METRIPSVKLGEISPQSLLLRHGNGIRNVMSSTDINWNTPSTLAEGYNALTKSP